MPKSTTKRRVVKVIRAPNAAAAKREARRLYRTGMYGCKVKVLGATLPQSVNKPYNVMLELTCTKGKK